MMYNKYNMYAQVNRIYGATNVKREKTSNYKLKEYLKEEILMGRIKPAEQIPFEGALAEKLSISRHTVRKAISVLINGGYLQSEHGHGIIA
jgi:GntR family transcriptional regulator of arabinose operon